MFSYRPDDAGEWLAAAAPACLALVHRGAVPGAGARLWASLAGGAQGVLDELTSAGLFNAPSFALLTWRGDAGNGLTVRAIVRGPVHVRLTSANGPVDLSGLDRSTWLEQSIAGVTGFVVECGETGITDAPGRDQAASELPLVSGLVRARWVASSDASDGTASPSVSPSRAVNVSAFAPAGIPHPVAQATIALATIAEETIAEETIAEVTVAEVTVAEPTRAEVPRAQDAETGYDHLFGATMMRGVEQAAVRPDDPDERDDAADPESGSAPGDTHDGLTIMSADLRKLRRAARDPDESLHRAVPSPLPTPPGPTLCLILPDGSREALGRPLLVGRAPSVAQVSGGALPRLISLAGTDQDISRNHVRFTVEGDTVVVTDLNSRNGTVIVLPGKSPQKLRGGESTSIIVGTVIDLGSGVTLTVGEV